MSNVSGWTVGIPHDRIWWFVRTASCRQKIAEVARRFHFGEEDGAV